MSITPDAPIRRILPSDARHARPPGRHRDRDRAEPHRGRDLDARSGRGRPRLRAHRARAAAPGLPSGSLRVPARAAAARHHQPGPRHARVVRHPRPRGGAARGRGGRAPVGPPDRGAGGAGAPARDRARPSRAGRLLPGRGDGPARGPPPRGAPGRRDGALVLSDAGRHAGHRGRGRESRRADLLGPRRPRPDDPAGHGRARARAGRRARLLDRVAPVRDPPFRLRRGDRRRRPLARARPRLNRGPGGEPMQTDRLKMPIGEAMFTQRSTRKLRTDPIPDRGPPPPDRGGGEGAERRQPPDGALPGRHRPREDPRVRRALPGSVVGQALGRSRLDEAGGHPARPTRTTAPRWGLSEDMKDVPCVVFALTAPAGGANSVIPACQNLMLAAHALGIGSLPTTLHADGDGPLPRDVRHPQGDDLPLLHPARLPGREVRPEQARPTSETTSLEPLGRARCRGRDAQARGQPRRGARPAQGHRRDGPAPRGGGLRRHLLPELRRRARPLRGARARHHGDPVRHQHRQHLHAPPLRLRADRGADPRARRAAASASASASATGPPTTGSAIRPGKPLEDMRRFVQRARRPAPSWRASCRRSCWRRCARRWSRWPARSPRARCGPTRRARTCPRRSRPCPPPRAAGPTSSSATWCRPASTTTAPPPPR